MNENRKRGTSNNKILTAIAIASLFIGSSKIMAIETSSEQVSWKKVLPMELPPTYTVNSR